MSKRLNVKRFLKHMPRILMVQLLTGRWCQAGVHSRGYGATLDR
jgi:hypothetical protein